jgi:hypothetical protein
MIQPCTWILLLLAVVSTQYALGQEREILVSGSYDRVPFEKFIESIESKTDCHFYFDEKLTDTLSVTGTFQNEPVGKILSKVLVGTDLHYAIDSEHNIYLSQSREIVTLLPDNFFGTGSTRPRMGAGKFDFSEYEKREKKRKLAENKIYAIGAKTNSLQGKAEISGYVKSAENGEPIIGASVFVENPLVGTATDPFGHFALTIPKGRHVLKIKSTGTKSVARQIMLYANGKLDIEVEEDVISLKEVVVESDREARVSSLQMSVEKLDIKTMKQMPLALGETDIMKVIQSLPGVQTVGEGTVGLNVRGGAASQNLILFNDATIYNPSHLFGFFSTFNPDVLKGVELFKGGIPADYGGRLSSVLDVRGREGNLKKFSATGGISPITARITLEGPIIKDRTSILIGFRSTYSDWIIRQLDSKQFKNSRASFYDVNLNFNHKFSDKDHLYITGYVSSDDFKLGSDTTYAYKDNNASVKWKHMFSNKFYGVLTSGYSRYEYSIASGKDPLQAFSLNFSIQQLNAKADFSYLLNSKHTLQAGVSTIRYSLGQGNLKPSGDQSLVIAESIQNEQGQESAIYLGDNFEVSPRFSLYAGLRYSFYQYLGPKDVNTYQAGVSREEATITGSTSYGAATPIATYQAPEPRLSVRYGLTSTSSVKLSYNRMRQYLQVLSNTTTIAPTDLWKLSDSYVNPQTGDQVSLGYYRNLKGNTIEFSVEGYYKTIKNAVDFKGGAVLLLNNHVETEVVNADGKAYGVEFFLKKTAGKLNGWVSYTYSRSLLQTNNSLTSETVNNGNYCPSNYDKPHAFNFVGNYKVSRRLNFSLNMTYSTGRPITLPLGKYDLKGSTRVYYSDRNEYRIPDYFRTDISINVEGNHKIKKLAHSSWTFAIYNLTGRANAFSVFFRSEGGKINAYKLSIFGRPIPTITYNFKF